MNSNKFSLQIEKWTENFAEKLKWWCWWKNWSGDVGEVGRGVEMPLILIHSNPVGLIGLLGPFMFMVNKY